MTAYRCAGAFRTRARCPLWVESGH